MGRGTEAADRRSEIGLQDGESLRQRAARGTLINSAFQVGFAALGALRRLVVAAFLTREEFGIWGIVLVTVMTLLWLKEIGIADKYVQQSDGDQEAAFQRAFTLELAYSLAFFVLLAVLLPAYALAYSTSEIILPGLLLVLAVPVSALKAPLWIPYRRMQYLRQRILESVDPVLAFVVTVALAVAGLGYWSLVIGVLAGTFAAAAVAVATSPYPLRLRYDRGTLGEYFSFSWPLVGFNVSNLLVVQGALLVGNRAVGLAGVGAIALASSISAFAERVDQIVSQTIYPAVCVVADRTEKLFETFVKSNRVALIWGMPFGVGLALFASDLVTFGFGEEWRPAAGLLAALGLIAAFRQVGFNYSVFFRAVNDTRPMFVSALANLGVFAIAGVPLILMLGLTGFALAFALMTAVQIAIRGVYLSRLFAGFRIWGHLLRAIAPSVPAAASILVVRAAVDAERTLGLAVAELVLYVVVTVAATAALERSLLRELTGYVRGRASTAGAA